ARRLYEDIRNLGCTDVELFPKKEILFYDIDASSYDSLNQRLKVISRLISNEKIIIIASLEALLDKIIIKDIFQKHTQEIQFGRDVNLDLLINNFINSGYERVHMVEAIGQFSVRGGIIDFFPPNSSNPYRIE